MTARLPSETDSIDPLLRSINASERLMRAAAIAVDSFYIDGPPARRFLRDTDDEPGGADDNNFTTGGAAVAANLWELEDELNYAQAVVSAADFEQLRARRDAASAWLADPQNSFGFTGTFGDLNPYTTSLAAYELVSWEPASDRANAFGAHLLKVYRKGWPPLRGVATAHPYVAYHVFRAAEGFLARPLDTIVEPKGGVDNAVDRAAVPKPECFKRDWEELLAAPEILDANAARAQFLSSAKRYLWEQHGYAAPGDASPPSLSYDPVGACFALNILVQASYLQSGGAEEPSSEGPTHHLAEFEDLVSLTLRHVLGEMKPSGALAYGLPFSYIDKGMGAFATSISGLAALVRVLNWIFTRSRRSFYKNANFLDSLLATNADGFERLLALPTATEGGMLRVRNRSGWSTDRAPSFERIESWVSMDVMLFAVHLRVLAQEIAQFHVVQRYGGTQITGEARWPYAPGTEEFQPVEGKRVLHDPDQPETDEERQTWSASAPAAVLHRAYGELMQPQNVAWELEKSSFLLFGPPGTSKSTLARSLAQALGWHYLELTPSNFVEQGLEMIERRSREIFEELGVLRESVVLFDELDSLLTDREQLDSSSILNFTVPAMLPKLQRLTKTAKRQRLLLIFATNYFDRLDVAIARRGRIDERLVVLPHNAAARRAFFRGAGLDGDELELAVQKTGLGVFEDLDQYRRALSNGGPPERPPVGVTPTLYWSRIPEKQRAAQRLALEVAEVVGRLLDDPRTLDADADPEEIKTRLESLRTRIAERSQEWEQLLIRLRDALRP